MTDSNPDDAGAPADRDDPPGGGEAVDGDDTTNDPPTREEWKRSTTDDAPPTADGVPATADGALTTADGALTTDGGVAADTAEERVGSRYRTAARFPTLLLARRNVSRAKLRSALAAAAIAIGVFAVATIGATGVAFKSQQLGTVESFGVGQVLLFPGPAVSEPFDATDVTQIEETVGEFGVVATSSEQVTYETRFERRTTQVTFLEDPRTQYAIGEGSLPPPDNWDRTAVVSAEFANDNGLAVGDRITLIRERQTPTGVTEYERTYVVEAILEPSNAFTQTSIYLPLEEADDETFTQVTVTTGSAGEATVAADRIEERFNGRKDRVTILEFTAIIELLTTITGGINQLLLILGAISMVVAAIAIANTMLMATIRRREEIGVLRAVGYGKRDILRVLLAEAAMIGAIGGLIGAVGAVAGTAVANALLGGELLAVSPGAAFQFSATQVAYFAGGVAFGIVVSLVAGFYPAWRAANERPVEALRG